MCEVRYFFILRLSRIPTVFFQEMEKNIFIADRLEIVPKLLKTKQTEYETMFYYAKNALREKKALNPNFDYTCIYISVLLHQYVL